MAAAAAAVATAFRLTFLAAAAAAASDYQACFAPPTKRGDCEAHIEAWYFED